MSKLALKSKTLVIEIHIGKMFLESETNTDANYKQKSSIDKYSRKSKLNKKKLFKCTKDRNENAEKILISIMKELSTDLKQLIANENKKDKKRTTNKASICYS